MRTLLIDNYDSYTYNLFQVIAEVNGELPLVYYNDEITLEQISSMVRAGTVHSIVISPGPGTPSNPHDIGVCLEVLQQLHDVPILGICLGHQALALAHGAAVVSAPEPVHGRLSRLRHNGHGLFADIPSGEGFEVVRYHSLLVDEASLPDCLEPVCWTAGGHAAVKLARDASSAASTRGAPGSQPQEPQPQADAQAAEASEGAAAQPVVDGAEGSGPGEGGALLMGLAHRTRPHYGVQFHPESVATRYGIALLRNFRDLAAAALRRQPGRAAAQLPASLPAVRDPVGPPGRLSQLAAWPTPEHQRGAPLRLAWTRLAGVLGGLGGSQGVFERLYGFQDDTFWLDSAAADRGRFSYMGGRGGPLWRKLSYKLPPPRPEEEPREHGRQPLPQHHPEPAAASREQHPEGAAPAAPSTSTCPGAAGPGAGEAAAGGCGTLAADSAAAGAGPEAGAGSGLGAAKDPDPEDAASSSSASSGSASSACGGGHSALGSSLGAPSSSCNPCTASPAPLIGTLTVETPDGATRASPATRGFLGHLQSLLASQRLRVDPEAAAGLPFNFWGGLVGYLGYELKAECGAAHAHAASTPDALMFMADRVVAVDHREGDVYLLAVYDTYDRAAGAGAGPGGKAGGCSGAGAEAACAGGEALARAWLAETQRALEAATAAPSASSADVDAASSAAQRPVGRNPEAGPEPGCSQPPVPFVLEHSRTAYLANIKACHAALRAGESYEVCLTTALSRPAAPDPPTLYRTLRQLNPAPYAAWLQFGPAGPTICCSSPERFLLGDRGGLLEARPIKGTAARVQGDAAADARAAAELASSEKERAENLMIVDLLRNDLGRVCEVGSVHVPGLMDIESYATVHQMVSTVRGVRRGGVSVVDCIRAAFPGGSMTGAPKVRTMAIIDALEARPRGVYSGCIGFIGLNDTFDLNIVIRTAIIEHAAPPPTATSTPTAPATELEASAPAAQPGATGPGEQRDASSRLRGCRMTIGAGGAIVVQSELEAEYEEMRLKARALLRAVGLAEGLGGPVPVLAD
ncbi:hypothetical protein HYH03_002221 [Edaphochlamys debaryana]|uniref:aminodeoxychorismate synthase n=1 Tax=Edaphochlamys debaryana TaxID=47281 RepID=A0A835YDX2_9CHLO|nr:hypothetical protein HYH03_002221 [Edaphochlamys debaryana]|eukprot:KAG2499934.1 hypothetical protein HYH03_002221 [Edaphochlamys debaryana]